MDNFWTSDGLELKDSLIQQELNSIGKESDFHKEKKRTFILRDLTEYLGQL